MLRIAGGVALGLAIFALLYVAALKLRQMIADEEADNPGALTVILIVIVGSIVTYFLATEVLG